MSDDTLKIVGQSAAAALVEMVAALECDYDRLEELKHKNEVAPDEMSAADAEELEQLLLEAGESESGEIAIERIQEDALSVEVRSGWGPPRADQFAYPYEEFKILLSTGGPASRIRGELDNGEPVRAWLEVQDWGTPWTQYFDIEQDTLLAYARCFYFGEG